LYQNNDLCHVLTNVPFLVTKVKKRATPTAALNPETNTMKKKT